MDDLAPIPAGAPRTLSPTDVSQYIRLDQCARYLRLRLHERGQGREFLYRAGVAPQAIPPILTRSGADFERRVEAQLRALPAARVVHANADVALDPRLAAPSHGDVVVALARELPPGGLLFLLQPRLAASVGQWRVRGDVDILRLERGPSGALSVLIADMKSSRAAKVEHRLQVAFYHELLASLFAAAGLAAELATAVLYRGPAEGAAPPSPEEARLQAGQRAQALALFGVADALLELVPDPEGYRAEVAALVTGPDSVAEQIARRPFAELPFSLGHKCDGCLYNEFCLRWAAERDDLSLLPHLADHEKSALRAEGLRTTAELAALKEFRDPVSVELVPAPAARELVRRLAVRPRVGPRLDELVHRARRYRAWAGDQVRSVGWIPSKGYGSLPFCGPAHNPNLVRVYVDAQGDYLHDRLYLLGALVVGAEAGLEPPARRRSVVRLAAAPPADPAHERDLLLRWVGEVFAAVAAVAAPDAQGLPRAPVHLIFVDALAQRMLLDALARHFGAVAAATPLYDFVTQIAAFDSPLVTFLDQEIRELKNYPMLCQSLQAVARHLRFDWDAPEPFAQIFRARLFDDRRMLDEDVAGSWYTARARFGGQIPLEYAYAAWGELPAPPSGDDDYADYRRATPALLAAFQARRLEAMEHVARDFKGNGDTEKGSFDLSVIASFSARARSLAQALDEFLTLERHAALGEWKRARLAPPERRVLAGDTLIVSYHLADQPPALVAALRENEARRLGHEQLRAEHEAARPGKAFRRTPAQRADTDPLPLPLPFRMRLDLAGVDCDLASALALSDLRPGDWVVLAPRWSEDERLPPAERRPLTPTVKQLLYGRRAILHAVDPAGFVEVELLDPRGGDKHGYVFPTVSALARPLVDGARYTLDPNPNDSYGSFCKEVVVGLLAGEPNTLYARLADPAAPGAAWPEAARQGQSRFMAGLDALRVAGLLHPFDPSQREFIERHGDAAILLVQGPPGTGKSYSTAFALLARLQGALAAGRGFRAFLSCKTHAATNVLLEKLAEVQALLRALRDQAPAVFDAYFDARILGAPLLRVRPSGDEAPAAATVLRKGEGELSAIRVEPWCFVGITPGATFGLFKGEGDRELADCLVLDEASQMNLPEACLAGLPLRPDGQLIVVGDHRQMPPIIAHAWADERRRTFQEFRAFESLFVALMGRDPAPPTVRFAESFRLHAVMAEFLRREIYARDGINYHSRRTGLLGPAPSPDPLVAAALDPAHPMVVVVHAEAASQVSNAFERDLAAALLAALADPAGLGLDPAHGLGVVVPHRAQRAALQLAVPALAARDPATGAVVASAVDTVERFQGGERRAILVSATESDPEYLRVAGEFLLDPRRLNVALSRAKEKLILVAARSVFNLFTPDEELFANAQLWKSLLRRACPVLLWSGERAGHRVEVWGSGLPPSPPAA